jgi:hypothetical protein
MLKIKNIVLVFVMIATALLGVLSCIYIYKAGLNAPPIRSDGFGYHAYLPSLLIDHDLSFRLAIANSPPGTSMANSYGIGVHPLTGRMFNKYALGTAILASPFFFLADIFVEFSNYERTGYSTPYQIANIAAAIFYMCFGTAVLFNILRRMYGELTATVTVALVVFATSVFHYGTYDASFSHIYSYAAISFYIALLFYYRNNKKEGELRSLILIGFALALVTLIRAPNAIVGLPAVGFIMEKASRSPDKRPLLSFSVFSAAFFIGVLPLPAYWQYATGNFIVNPYKVFPLSDGSLERFYWGNPEIFNFLFSVRKGLFFWSPTILLAFAGLPFLIRQDKVLGSLVMAVLCLHVYVGSSWWSWYFGGSFGSRTFVDMMPIVALPLAIGISRSRKFISNISIWTLTAILVVTNITLMYSYWRGYIPFDGTRAEDIYNLPNKLKITNHLLNEIDKSQVKFINLKVDSLLIVDTIKLRVELTNNSKESFNSLRNSDSPIRLSWRFVPLGTLGERLSEPGWDGRKNLDFKIQPNEKDFVSVSLPVPLIKGKYILEVSLVKEGEFWFHDSGMKIVGIPLDLTH